MAKLIVLQGCPCSGKTTWRKQYVEQNPETIVACLDDIRYHIGNGKYSFDHEDRVREHENYIVDIGLKSGHEVIVDATNLNPKTISKWKAMAEKHNCEIEFKEFYVPITEAIKRSKKRKEEGGLYISKNVLFTFYKKYYPNEFIDNRLIKENDHICPNAVICDLDGTLALHVGRTPFEWDKIETDKIDPRLRDILNMYMEKGILVIFVTGRDDSAKENTINWLKNPNNKLSQYWCLYTRKSNDRRAGEVYKKEVYDKYIKDNYNVLCVFEDHSRCVQMWRNEGLLTCQVANLDY